MWSLSSTKFARARTCIINPHTSGHPGMTPALSPGSLRRSLKQALKTLQSYKTQHHKSLSNSQVRALVFAYRRPTSSPLAPLAPASASLPAAQARRQPTSPTRLLFCSPGLRLQLDSGPDFSPRQWQWVKKNLCR